MTWLSFCVALGLAAVHLLAGKLRFLDVTPRSIWLSAAGGASVAYVFLHILPDLAKAQESFDAPVAGFLTSIERHVWLLSLGGLSVFYGLERLVRQSGRNAAGQGSKVRSQRVFWLHIGSFTVYNLVFGYLLQNREQAGARNLLLFGAAIGLHFIVNDFGLRRDHQSAYDRTARWILGAAVLAGSIIGIFAPIERMGVEALYAVLAGGIILNVLKEELPEERESRFWAFAAGAGLYGGLLLLAA